MGSVSTASYKELALAQNPNLVECPLDYYERAFVEIIDKRFDAVSPARNVAIGLTAAEAWQRAYSKEQDAKRRAILLRSVAAKLTAEELLVLGYREELALIVKEVQGIDI